MTHSTATYLLGSVSSLRSRMVGMPAKVGEGRLSQADFSRLVHSLVGVRF